MFIGVNGIQLYYEKTGQGRPLIMVHGNGEDHTIFGEAVAVLKEKFTCYTVDSRGHGQSSPCKELHYKDMAQDMIAFMTELGLEDVAFYGFSDGGIVALLAAMTCSRITNLVVSGANITTKGTKLWFRIYLDVVSIRKKDPLIELMKKEPSITTTELSKIKVKKWLGIPDLPPYEEFCRRWHNFLEQVREFLDHNDPEGTYRRQICIYLLNQFFLCDWSVDDFYAAFDEKLNQARQHLGFAG